MAQKVEETFRQCLYYENENNEENKTHMIKVYGIIGRFGLDPIKIENYKPEIQAFINELPDEFGDGWSFLNMCMDRNGEQWGEHTHCEMLMVLGVAAGLLEYCLPRRLWPILPGGMPYIQIKKED